MTTSVIYDSALRGLNLATAADGAVSAQVATNTIYSNLSTMLTTGVTQVQSVNNSASTTNPNATFTNTPTNGNALMAIVWRQDNIASTNASWTLLSSSGVAGNRRVEIWWRRAGASEPKLHTWTNATAATWDLTMMEFGGWAAVVNPINYFSVNQTTSVTGTGSLYDAGVLCVVSALAVGNTVTGMTVTGTNAESTTSLPVTTTARFAGSIVDAYTNREDQTIAFSWTTARGYTVCQAGWPNGAGAPFGVGFYVGNESTTAGTATTVCGQLGLSFDTSSIPTANTVTSATLSMKTAGSGYGNVWPANASIDAYSLAGASIAASNANGCAVWKTPTEIGALTRVATRAAGATTAINTTYDWTSDSAFLSNVNKASTTTLLIASSDQQTGTTRSTNQYAVLSSTAGSVHYLTIIHNLQLNRSVAATSSLTPAISRIVSTVRSAASTLNLTPAITRLASYARTIAASTTQVPAITRLASYARTIAGTSDLTSTISRIITFARTISNTITTTPTILTARSFLRTIAASSTVTPAITAARTVVRIIAASVTTTASIVATLIPIVVGIPHKISLRVRSTVTLPGLERIRLTVRSRLRLPE